MKHRTIFLENKRCLSEAQRLPAINYVGTRTCYLQAMDFCYSQCNGARASWYAHFKEVQPFSISLYLSILHSLMLLILPVSMTLKRARYQQLRAELHSVNSILYRFFKSPLQLSIWNAIHKVCQFFQHLVCCNKEFKIVIVINFESIFNGVCKKNFTDTTNSQGW